MTNGRVVKMLKKYTKRNYMEYLHEIKKWPFEARWRLSWYILFGKQSRGG